jgi:hypothetical protein
MLDVWPCRGAGGRRSRFRGVDGSQHKVATLDFNFALVVLEFFERVIRAG